ncbi:DUF805 domain-containing protein [Pseudomonas luteola]
MELFIRSVKMAFVIKGRACRKEYWMFWLVSMLIGAAIKTVETAMHVDSHVISQIYNAVILIPTMTVGIRRMHDVNKSGWYIAIFMLSPSVLLLINLIFNDFQETWIKLSMIGAMVVSAGALIYFVYLLCKAGTVGENRFGPDPRPAALSNQGETPA